MALIEGDIYFARLADGWSKEEAFAAAEIQAARSDPMPRILHSLKTIKWMVAASIMLSLLLLVMV